jgi:hypothetical protein
MQRFQASQLVLEGELGRLLNEVLLDLDHAEHDERLKTWFGPAGMPPLVQDRQPYRAGAHRCRSECPAAVSHDGL